MFRFNRFFFIVTNFLIAFTIFLFIFLLRYKYFDFHGVEKRSLNFETIFLFLLYSSIIVIFNISFKIYEINKISQIKESLLINLIISFTSIGTIGAYFYFTQTNFARFVFFLGFLSVPVILSLYNKLLFFLTIKNKKSTTILYYGSYENFNIFESLISEYKKWIPVEINKVTESENLSDLKKMLNKYDLLVVDSDQNYTKSQFEILNNFEVTGGRIFTLVDMFNYFDQSIPSEIIKNQHFELFSTYKLDSFYNKFIKRIGDIFISIVLLILTSPIMLIFAIFIGLTSKGAIIYKQKRVGYKGKEFDMFKFRSMIENAEEDRAKMTKTGDSRITIVGKIMRPLRIDELPQLINILIGDMSFIGPRPEREEFIKQILEETPLFKKRLLVKPGLTGWAQVKYAYVNNISQMNKKLSYDLYYINNLTILFDFKILLYTIDTIIFRRGAI
ncbi:MAG TPA: exopolysaccharide biosynthesis polyprenyl glycosylphosphotransferase [Spirochaetota bacterium]|nr:exopolysaccharide biosynthesis polyprenyl glycosylphosphotransferase [Spirochaetota bacterium]